MGLAIYIEEYVPTTTPTINAKENGCKTFPPIKNNTITTIKVVIEAVNPIVGTNNGTLDLGLSPNRGIGGSQYGATDLLATVDYNSLRLNEQGRRVAALYGGTSAGAIGGTGGIIGEALDQFIKLLNFVVINPLVVNCFFNKLLKFSKNVLMTSSFVVINDEITLPVNLTCSNFIWSDTIFINAI